MAIVRLLPQTDSTYYPTERAGKAMQAVSGRDTANTTSERA